jgi:hypothetical protein
MITAEGEGGELGPTATATVTAPNRPESRHAGGATAVSLQTHRARPWWRRGRKGLVLLLEAHEIARELKHDPWDLAVEIGELRRGGLSRSVLRYLICRGCVEHAREIDAPTGTGRAYHDRPPGVGLRFSKSSCFVLTEAGVTFASRVLRRRRTGRATGRMDGEAPRAPTVPTWDSLRQELRVGQTVVKRFKVKAVNQTRVLSAFEEEGWPPSIDDPLPRCPRVDAKRRLHDTINSLNRNQQTPLIRFLGNGTGEAFGWEFV